MSKYDETHRKQKKYDMLSHIPPPGLLDFTNAVRHIGFVFLNIFYFKFQEKRTKITNSINVHTLLIDKSVKIRYD